MKSTFLKNTLILTSGTALAQMISLFVYPVLSRLYRPEQFGVLASVVAVSGILSTVGTLQYSNGILVQKREDYAVNLLSLSFILSFIINLVAVPALLGLYYLGVLDKVINPQLIILAAVIAFCVNIYTIYNEWCVRCSYFKQVTLNKITNSATNALSKVGFAFLSYTQQSGLLIGELFGRILTAGICVVHLSKKNSAELKEYVKFKKILEVAKSEKRFPIYTLPAQFFNTFAGQLPIFYIGSVFSQEQLGFFSMSFMVLSLPITIIGQALYDSFRNKANELYKKNGECKDFYKKNLKIITLIAIASSIITIPVLPWLFKTVLGGQWYQAGIYAQYLAPMTFIGLVNTVFTSLWIIADKLKGAFFWQILYFLVTWLSMMIGTKVIGTVEGTLICLTLGLIIVYIINIVFTWNFAKGNN